jgi:hypothetical protein
MASSIVSSIIAIVAAAADCGEAGEVKLSTEIGVPMQF